MDQRLLDAGLLPGPVPADPYDRAVGRLVVRWFDEDLAVEVLFHRESNDLPPTEAQIAAFVAFAERRETFFAELPARLAAYYESARLDSDLDSETVAELFPPVTDPMQLRALLRPPYLVVGHHLRPGSLDYIGLGLGCTWDEEHALGIKVVGDRIEIGAQDLVT